MPCNTMLGGATVGTVDAVEPHLIKVLLEVDAPQATALNTGIPSAFPRINGYVLLPNEVGATIGMVSAVRIESAQFPKRPGLKDFGLIDLPFPRRMLWVTPVGTLVRGPVSRNGEPEVEVRRGVDVFPSVGDPVALPDAQQLRAIVEGESGRTNRRITIGRSPIVGSAPVMVDPNRMFGRHLAVLGNTGSGKSCSVAGLVRWCLEAARTERRRTNRTPEPDARFIVLDPNGEYARAFSGLQAVVLQVEPEGWNQALRLPAWMWNGEEWCAFTGAAPGVQQPLLLEALRHLRSGGVIPDPALARIGDLVRSYEAVLNSTLASGDYLRQGRREGVGDLLSNLSDDLINSANSYHGDNDDIRERIHSLSGETTEIEEAARGRRKDNGVGWWHNPFPESRLVSLREGLRELRVLLGESNRDSCSEDIPRRFNISDLSELVDGLARSRDLSQFVETLKLRINTLMSQSRLAAVASSAGDSTLLSWLRTYIGGHEPDEAKLVIVDLSLIPSDVVHVVVAVLSRLIFEALQRYRRETRTLLPTVLVLDEAHTFAHRELAGESAKPSAQLCCRIIERISREGRKFGLGLVLASQRPSELSPTVLSQCNTFLLHRIVNDRDQDLVRRLVPDSLGGLLNELPSLPARRAILLGWAVPSPVLVEVNELPPQHRPQSPDPGFWEVWTGDPVHGLREVDLEALATRWVAAETIAPDEPGNGQQAPGLSFDGEDDPF